MKICQLFSKTWRKSRSTHVFLRKFSQLLPYENRSTIWFHATISSPFLFFLPIWVRVGFFLLMHIDRVLGFEKDQENVGLRCKIICWKLGLFFFRHSPSIPVLALSLKLPFVSHYIWRVVFKYQLMCTGTYTHTHTHTLTLSLSLSLYHTHTHTHTHMHAQTHEPFCGK